MCRIAEIDKVCNTEIITGTGEVLTDTTEKGKIRPWSKKKMANLETTELFLLAKQKDSEVISDSRLYALRECGNFLRFAETDEGRRLVDANFCRVRLCPMCNWRRSLKMFAQVSEVTDAILRDKPTVRFLFVTLTLKNVEGDKLGKTLDEMNAAFKLMTQKRQKFALAKGLKESLQGYLKAVEVVYNAKRNDYHPHIHCLFEVSAKYFDGKNYVKHSEWREIWKSALKLDYLPMVNVKVIKNSKPKAVAEVAKYPTKMETLAKLKNRDQAADALIVLKNSLHKRRLLTFGGDFKEYRRQLKLDDVEMGDLVHADNDLKELNAIAYTLFVFDVTFGGYICK